MRGNAAPFVETVNVPHHVRRYAVARTIVTSPLMRAVYAPRRRASVAYHPAYLTGRVIRITPQTVVLQPPTGTAVAVNCGCGDRASDFYRRFRTGTFATVPAVYSNGSYYAYGYSPQYYPQVAQWYSNYYGTPVTYSNGYYVPQTTYYGGSSWDNDADDAAGGSPYYGSYGYGPGYAGGTWDNDADGAQYAAAPTPYDSCMWSDDDNDGDGSCAGAQPAGYYGTYGTPYGYSNNGYSGYNGYGYNNYGYNGAYAAQQLQGLVVAKTGSILMVLGGNGFKPVIVDAAPALQNGFAVNGPVAVGQVIDAYGYYNGDTFTATALM